MQAEKHDVQRSRTPEILRRGRAANLPPDALLTARLGHVCPFEEAASRAVGAELPKRGHGDQSWDGKRDEQIQPGG